MKGSTAALVLTLTFVVSFITATALFDTAARAMGFYDTGLQDSFQLQRGF